MSVEGDGSCESRGQGQGRGVEFGAGSVVLQGEGFVVGISCEVACSGCIQHIERIRSGSGFSMQFGPVRMMQFTYHIWLASHTMSVPMSLHMQFGKTALTWSARGGHLETVKLLLDRGARLEHQSKVPRD